MAVKYYRPWHKRVLVPFWIIHIAWMLWLIISSCIVLAYRGGDISGVIIIVTLSTACLVLDIVEIFAFMRHKLKPALYLMLQVLKTTLWSVLFVLSSVGMAQIAGRAMDSDVPTALVAGFVQVLIVFLSFLATLIYGSVIYHRARRALRAHASAHVEDGIPASAPALALAPAPSPVFEMAGKSNTSNFSSPRQREHELEVQQQHQHQTSPEMRHENKVW